MSKRQRGLVFLLAIALIGYAFLAFSPLARAEIAQDFKGELIDQANAIAADAELFRQLVRTEVSGNIILAKGEATKALALLKRNGVQTSIINTALENAKGYIEQAQTGVNNARDFKEFYLVREVQSLSAKVDLGEASGKITQTEAWALKKILNDCLNRCLTDVNLTLVDISKNLAGATLDFTEAQGYLQGSPSRSDLLRAKSRVTSGLRRLESAWRGEMRIKGSIKCFIYGLYTFKREVLMAPLKTSSLAFPGGLKVLGAGPGPGGGLVRFLASGLEVQALRVQVFSLTGRPVYDSGFIAGNALEWSLRGSQGQPLANGVYLYVVAVKGYDGSVIKSEVRKLVILR